MNGIVQVQCFVSGLQADNVTLGISVFFSDAINGYYAFSVPSYDSPPTIVVDMGNNLLHGLAKGHSVSLHFLKIKATETIDILQEELSEVVGAKDK